MAARPPKGLTLVELLLAAALLATAAVPVIEATTRGLDLAYQVDVRTKAVMLAQQEMESAMARLMENFALDVTQNSADLGDGYRVTIQAVTGLYKKTFTVRVGRDKNGNSILDGNEVLIALATSVPDMTAY